MLLPVLVLGVFFAVVCAAALAYWWFFLKENHTFGTYFAQGLEHFAAKEYSEALWCFLKSYSLDNQSAEACYQVGCVYKEVEEPSNACEWFERSVDLYPNDANTLYNLAVLYIDHASLAESEDMAYEKAKSYLERALEQDDNNPDVTYTLGLVENYFGNYAESEAWYVKTTEISPYYPKAYYQLALLAEADKNNEKAVELYEKVLVQDADDTCQLGHRDISHKISLFNTRLEHFDEAIISCRRTVTLDDTFSKGYNQLGLVAYCMDNFVEAIEAYEKALELDPGYATAYNNLAYAYQKNDNITRAIQTFNKYLSFTRDLDEISEISEQISRLEADLKSGKIKDKHDVRRADNVAMIAGHSAADPAAADDTIIDLVETSSTEEDADMLALAQTLEALDQVEEQQVEEQAETA